jgi:6-phosphogluconolactonase (cycloisomerase 2 family)
VALHPRLPVLYAANELPEGTVTTFAVGPDASLTPVGQCPTGGASPCHLDVLPDGDRLVVANYATGSVAVIRLDADGVPVGHEVIDHSGQGPDPERQEGPHAHMVVPHDGGVLAVDLGADVVYHHRADPSTGGLAPGQPVIRFDPGTGPRHLTVDPAGRLHAVGELSGTLLTYARSGSGEGWSPISAIPCTTAGSAYPSAIVADADGRFLYVANRGPDTVAVFSLAGDRPTRVGEVPSGGSWPRDLALVEPYLYVANERSGTVVAFRIDPVTGVPTPTGDVLATPSPTCVVPNAYEWVTSSQ